MDSSGGSDPSLSVDSPVNIEGLQELDRSGWEEEVMQLAIGEDRRCRSRMRA